MGSEHINSEGSKRFFNFFNETACVMNKIERGRDLNIRISEHLQNKDMLRAGMRRADAKKKKQFLF